MFSVGNKLGRFHDIVDWHMRTTVVPSLMGWVRARFVKPAPVVVSGGGGPDEPKVCRFCGTQVASGEISEWHEACTTNEAQPDDRPPPSTGHPMHGPRPGLSFNQRG